MIVINWRMTTHLRTGSLFVEAFSETVEELRAKKEERERMDGVPKRKGDWHKNAFAKKVFGDNETASGKYQRILKVVKRTGKTQNIPLEEAYALADALGYEFVDFIRKVEDRVELKMEYPLSKKESA